MSESEIKNELDSMGAGLGAYFLEINVEAESGNALGCNHTAVSYTHLTLPTICSV